MQQDESRLFDILQTCLSVIIGKIVYENLYTLFYLP